MDKSKAIEVLSNNGISTDLKNVSFSNVNKTNPVWWLTIDNEKFKQDLYLVLYNNSNNLLYVFFLPTGTFKNPAETLYQRGDKNSSALEIVVDDRIFVDKKSRIDFSKYLIKKIACHN